MSILPRYPAAIAEAIKRVPGLIFEIEIEKYDINPSERERTSSASTRFYAFGDRLEVRLRDEQPLQALAEQDMVVKQ